MDSESVAGFRGVHREPAVDSSMVKFQSSSSIITGFWLPPFCAEIRRRSSASTSRSAVALLRSPLPAGWVPAGVFGLR